MESLRGGNGAPPSAAAKLMAMPVSHIVQNSLRATELCKFAIRVDEYHEKYSQSCILAIVVSTSDYQESALFVLLTQDGTDSLAIIACIPINSSIQIVPKSDKLIELRIAKPKLGGGIVSKSLIFEAETTSDLHDFILEFNKAAQFAGESKAVANGSSHSWLRAYTIVSPRSLSSQPSLQRTSSLGIAAQSYTESLIRKIPSLDSFGLQYMRKRLRERSHEYTISHNIKITISTWNMNGKLPREPITPIFLNSFADIYVIGLQEFDLRYEAFLVYDTDRADEWRNLIRSELNKLHEGQKYLEIASRQLAGLYIAVFGKEEMVPLVKEIQTARIGVGVMGMGNKGAVAVRFRMSESTFCFVNSHLAAELHNVRRRNQDFHDIFNNLVFEEGQPRKISDHEQIFWLGDLNYRIPLDNNDVRQLCQQGKHLELLKNDQLLLEMQARRVFNGFKEGPITFAPTFKFDVGTHNFDSSKKQRVPAWCDRILWGEACSVIQLLKYVSIPELVSSDHKPVCASFATKVSVNIPEKLKTVFEEIKGELAVLEVKSVAECTVSDNSLDFGKVRFRIPLSRQITIVNTGGVVAKFVFPPKSPNTPLKTKPWLVISPTMGVLLPKESVTINFMVLVDELVAIDLNANKEYIEDIVVLRIENSKDYFINISGEYLKSCFACSLSQLLANVGPVRDPYNPKITRPPSIRVPTELWRLVDYISQFGLDEEKILQESGEEEECQAIREALDQGEPFPNNLSLHSYAETLIWFIDSIPDGLIPISLYTQCINNHHLNTVSRQVLSLMPKENELVFYYLMDFIKTLLTHPSNGLTEEKAALIFGDVILKPFRGSSLSHRVTRDDSNQKMRQHFIQQFLKR